jgi:Stage II sporulation protein E (SpoIIE)
MRALGGDCYDFASLGNSEIAMFVGDASGKGIAAALMIASVQASLRTAAQFTGDNLVGFSEPLMFRPAPRRSLTTMRGCFVVYSTG